jgi:ribulose-phosphate 3-epimerase
MKIAPSILSADFAILGEEIKRVEKLTDILHVDVMDGHFVPNITIGVPVVKSVRKMTHMPIYAHLMISDPGKFAVPFARAGADLIGFHIEAVDDPIPIIKAIREEGKKVGIAINPPTQLSEIEPYLDKVDLVIVMTVNPGFGGQKFIESVVPKIQRLRSLIDKNKYKVEIEVDGGITGETALKAKNAGADILVSGSYIFGSPNYAEAIRRIKSP